LWYNITLNVLKKGEDEKMQKLLLRHRMLTMGLSSLLLAALTLAACGGGASTPASEEATPASQTEEATEETLEEEPEEVAQAEQAEAEAEPVEAESVPTDVAQEESLSVPNNSPEATCQGVTIPENQLIAAASEDDWARGPADAGITVIEYGDFQ
jgi:hypothetical protein